MVLIFWSSCVITIDSSLLSKLLLTSWVYVSGFGETDIAVKQNIFDFCCFLGVGGRSPPLKTENNWPLVMTTFLIMSFAEALVTVQSPILPKRWQHWVTGGFWQRPHQWPGDPPHERIISCLHSPKLLWPLSKLLDKTVTLSARTREQADSRVSLSIFTQ